MKTAPDAFLRCFLRESRLLCIDTFAAGMVYSTQDSTYRIKEAVL